MQLKNMNKKAGITFNMVNMIPRFIFMIFVLITFMLTINVLLRPDPQTKSLEMDLFTFSLLNSPHGISYFDPDLNRVIPNTINLEDFETNLIEERLNNSFYYGDENLHIAARITLADKQGNELANVFYNGGLGKTYGFEYWAPVAIESGRDVPSYYVRSMPILIRDNSLNNLRLYPGTVLIEVVTP